MRRLLFAFGMIAFLFAGRAEGQTPTATPTPTPCLAAITVKKVGGLSIVTTRGTSAVDWGIYVQNDDGSTVFSQVYDSENVSTMVTSTDVPTNLALRIVTNAVGPAVSAGDSYFVQYSDASDASVSAYLFVPATTSDTTYYYGPDHRCYLDAGRCDPAPVYSPSPSVVPASPTPSPSPTASPSPAPSPTANPSATPSPEPSKTPEPSPTATPTAAPSPTTQPSPTPQGYESPTPAPTPAYRIPAGVIRRRLAPINDEPRSF